MDWSLGSMGLAAQEILVAHCVKLHLTSFEEKLGSYSLGSHVFDPVIHKCLLKFRKAHNLQDPISRVWAASVTNPLDSTTRK